MLSSKISPRDIISRDVLIPNEVLWLVRKSILCEAANEFVKYDDDPILEEWTVKALVAFADKYDSISQDMRQSILDEIIARNVGDRNTICWEDDRVDHSKLTAKVPLATDSMLVNFAHTCGVSPNFLIKRILICELGLDGLVPDPNRAGAKRYKD